MIVHAASGDTWGVSGPTFLRFYLVAAALVVAVAVYHRVRLAAGSTTAPTADALGPQQVAYLNGGPRLAVHAALGGLRGSGAIGVRPDRRLTTAGAAPTGLTPLEQAVHWAAHQHARVADLPKDERVRAALDRLRDGLEHRGLLNTDAQRARARLWTTLLIGLLGLGVFRFVSGLFNGQPVGYLLLTLVTLLIVTLVLRRAPALTRAGRAALRGVRREHTHLAPASAPAYATYGAAGAAMGVALYGTASLWALDPGFAEQAEIQRQAASGSGWSGGGDGSSGGGESSGSDGGSSCGGGGGCGGGGCGG
ncbi:TIGR04222 domain-containing membrane protein [Micromonospora sp. WMMD1155]|uniref:TIGR04222 domain-containing membrane protein n=1 Tax=Micromonospora sp. WMMD1155 TaxID=3016094 RepID=UPI002499B21A|nr:TIGR04222 domain-containing membrane protein [Micromonospora sp. WMMD1155]WFE52825.1 TIGR04222 domain-containing membrane protein [Micromonospora sp. WMMD1155]